MFGFPMPDLGEMVKQIEDWKQKFERLVSAVETAQKDIALIKAELKISEYANPVITPAMITQSEEK